MPTLRMSSQIAQNIVYVGGFDQPAFVGLTSGGSGYDNLYPFGGFVGAAANNVPPSPRINIYKGTPATFPSFTDLSTRSSDLLIQFVLLDNSRAVENMGIVNQKVRWLIGKCLTVTAAVGSGTATWFLAYGRGFGTGTSNSLTIRGALLGSVGATGSGADLEIPNTDIVSGANYQSAGFYINFPQNRTF
jgi:hypothetical protein